MTQVTQPETGSEPQQWRSRAQGWAASVAALLAVALALVAQYAVTRTGASWPAWTFLLAALTLVAALYLHGRGTAAWEPAAAGGGEPLKVGARLEVAALVAVLALAVFFRFYRFLSFPPALWYDEAVNAVDALSIIDRDHITVWRSSNFGHSTLYFYLLIVSFKLFGYTVFAMRVVPVMAGLAALAALYVLARHLLGQLGALAAAGLMAVSRYAVTFSRLSWEASLQPLFEILAVYFLIRGLETRSWWRFALAGAALAAGLYTYLAFRFVPFVLLFILAYAAAAQWSLIRRNGRGLIVYAIAFLIAFAPLGQFAIKHQDQFLARTRDINVFREIDQKNSYAPLWHNLRATAKMLNVQGDVNGRHNIPRAPMLDDVSGALLLLGLAVAVWRIRDWRRGAIGGWLVLALLPGVFTVSIENPSAIRSVGAIPPIFLLAGMAVAAVQRPLWRSRVGRAGAVLGVVALVAVSAAVNYRDLFQVQAKSRVVYDAFVPVTTDVGEFTAREAGARSLYVDASFASPATQFLGRGKTYRQFESALTVPLRSLSADGATPEARDAAVVLTNLRRNVALYLQQLYPSATREDRLDPFGRFEYIVVRVPAAEVASLHQVRVTYRNLQGDGATVTRDEDTAAHTWPADLPAGINYPFEMTVEGALDLTDPRIVQLRFRTPGEINVQIDGIEPQAARDDLSLPLPPSLERGARRISARMTVEGDGETVWAMQRQRDGFRDVSRDLLLRAPADGVGWRGQQYQGANFEGTPVLTVEPFVGPARRIDGPYSAIIEGDITVPVGGRFSFAIESQWPTEMLIDGETVVKYAGGGWGTREGEMSLTAGVHRASIRYSTLDRADWEVRWRRAGDASWHLFSGGELSERPGDTAPPTPPR